MRKKKTMKSTLLIVAAFLGGVFAAPMIKPYLSKLPVIGGFLGGKCQCISSIPCLVH